LKLELKVFGVEVFRKYIQLDKNILYFMMLLTIINHVMNKLIV